MQFKIAVYIKLIIYFSWIVLTSGLTALVIHWSYVDKKGRL